MHKPGGCVIRSDGELESCGAEPQVILTPSLENVTMMMVNDRPENLRGSGERRLREEALAGFRSYDKPSSLVVDSHVSSAWNDVKVFATFVLSLTFGIILPIVQFVIGGLYFGTCHDGNTLTIYLFIGGMLDIVGCSTFTGLVQRLTQKEELPLDPQTEWSKRIWNSICAMAVVAWIVVGQMKIYYITHHGNPFRRGLPCAQEIGLTFYAQVFIAIKTAAIALGLSLGVTFLLLKNEGHLCWRRYRLKKKPSV